MNFKTYHRTFLSLLISTAMLPNAEAAMVTTNDKPDKCPSVAALQSVQVQESDLVETERGHSACCTASGFPYWVDGKWDIRDYVGNFGTKVQWKFRLHEATANNASDALKKMKEAQASLSFYSGPNYYMGRWSCTYFSSQGDVGTDYLRE